MQLFLDWLLYIRENLQNALNLIMSNWLSATMFGLNIIYLVLNAFKLKKNTD